MTLPPAGAFRQTCLTASVFLVLSLTGACTKSQPVQAKQESGPVAIRMTTVEKRSIRRVVQSIGTLFPMDETIISAEIGGRVDDVKVDLGDSVNKGQVLARISDEEQRYILAQNEAQLRMALERLGLKNENDNLKDVRESSEVRMAQADLTDAEQRYKRTRTLIEQGIGSQQDLDQAAARYKLMQATYDQANNTVRNLLGDIARQKAAVDLQRKKLRDTTVYAPYAGQIKERQVTRGLYVQPNTPLFTIVKTDPLRLRLEIPERMAPWIRGGQTAEVNVEAFQDRKFQGKIWRIAPTVDQTKRTFVVEALINNPNSELKAGSYARASLPTNKSESIRVIPVAAVTYVFGSNKAFLVNKGVIEARDVKLGDRIDEDVEILEGLDAGDEIAMSQLNKLDTGTRVTRAGGANGARTSAARKAD